MYDGARTRASPGRPLQRSRLKTIVGRSAHVTRDLSWQPGGMGSEAALKAVAAAKEIIHSERAGAADAAPEAEGGFSLEVFGPREREGEGDSGSESEDVAKDIITCDHCDDDCTAESFNFMEIFGDGSCLVETDLCSDCFDPHHCD